MTAHPRPTPRRRSAWRRIARLLVLLAVIGGGTASWYLWKSPATATAAPETAAVSRATIRETVLASGVLQSSRLVSVGAQVSGIVQSLDVALGDTVTAGQTVARIDSIDQENALLSAQAQLDQLNAQRQAQAATLEQAEHALTRAQGMSDRGVITEVDLESAGLAVSLAQAQLAQIDAQIAGAEVQIETARTDLDRTVITAPISGTVVAVTVSEGQTLSAQSAAPTVMKIADLDTMVIEAEISEADVVNVAAGQRVWFTVMGDPDTRIEAVLTSVAPAPAAIADSDEISGDTAVYYVGRFEVPNPDHSLRIAMSADVTVVLAEAADVLTVPVSAVTTGPDGQDMVQLWDATTATLRPVAVETGLDDDVSVEIIAGLSEGDLVVATGGSAPVESAAAQGGPGGMGAPPGMGFPGM
jgi:macrolide-specific efflux system membrane fusion protein